MQSLNWYARRLRAMGPAEIAGRCRTALRTPLDRFLLPRRQRPHMASSLVRADAKFEGAFRVSDMPVGAWSAAEPGSVEAGWRDRLTVRADAIAAHRLSYFDLEDHHHGDPIDWNRDHKAGIAAPMEFSPSIDYRDIQVTGDCKFVWEPNRHQHLVVLGRAYRATGNSRYAEAVAEQLESWLDQCPYGVGMNWRSPLELGVRLINWVWALELIRESGVIAGTLRTRLLESAALHVWEIARNYSRGSSANNHLIGEAAGVWVAAGYFDGLADAARYRKEAGAILQDEIFKQTFEDGGGREQAFGYQVFVIQFFLIAGLVARKRGEDFPKSYWDRLELMLEFVAAMLEGGARLPMVGDADDGYVLDLDNDPVDPRGWLCIGAEVFGREDWADIAGTGDEAVTWLCDTASGGNQRPAQAGVRLESRAFPQSGYYLLQSGRRHERDRISIVFDCGSLGYGPLAAHGHADALSFTLRAFGEDVLVDPGTYDYFSYPEWRAYFRSTRAHNTIVIDDLDQSEVSGLFLWERKARARCIEWAPSEGGGRIVAEHDGYTRLSDPVVHRRTLELDGPAGLITIRDEIVAHEEHDTAIYFHLAETCRWT
ncbi:MAG: alginate lyase family protein, partial [Planctomycetes bacterium]|nr:alginate lyase family protein [Planctomycetota bacterium]